MFSDFIAIMSENTALLDLIGIKSRSPKYFWTSSGLKCIRDSSTRNPELLCIGVLFYEPRYVPGVPDSRDSSDHLLGMCVGPLHDCDISSKRVSRDVYRRVRKFFLDGKWSGEWRYLEFERWKVAGSKLVIMMDRYRGS